MGRGRGHGHLLLGPAQTGCPPAARAGGRTSLGWAQEAALECPRRKTADRNIPLRALLGHGRAPGGDTTPRLREEL